MNKKIRNTDIIVLRTQKHVQIFLILIEEMRQHLRNLWRKRHYTHYIRIRQLKRVIQHG